MRRGVVTGSFPSLKCGTSVPYETTLERDYLYTLEWEADLVSYQWHPFAIPTPTGTLTPNFLLTFLAHRALVVLTHTPAPDLGAGAGWAEARDYDWQVVQATDLRREPRLSNLKLLWRSARLAVPHAVLPTCRDILAAGPLPINEVVASLSAHQTPLLVVHNLIFHHLLTIDVTRPLTPDSLVWGP